MVESKQKADSAQSLRTWNAPQLMRLNQADGTDKHITVAEGVAGTAFIYPTCTTVDGRASGGGGVCGPS